MKKPLLLAASLLFLAPIVVVAVPANAAPVSCHDGDINIGSIAKGCVATSGTITFDDGRTVVIPEPGMTVTASSVATAGSGPIPVIRVSNTSQYGVTVRLGDDWFGPLNAVEEDRATLERWISARQPSAAADRPTLGANSSEPGETQASCGNWSYALAGYDWLQKGTVNWYYKTAGQGVAGQAAVGQGATAWTHQTSACGFSFDSAASSHFVANTAASPSVSSTGGCVAQDNVNVVGWGNVSVAMGNTLAATCTWQDNQGNATETDQKYNYNYTWTASSACSGNTYDLQAVATHEWGHTFGLNHTVEGTGLVMAPSTSPCNTTWRTLGLGDIYGDSYLYG